MNFPFFYDWYKFQAFSKLILKKLQFVNFNF